MSKRLVFEEIVLDATERSVLKKEKPVGLGGLGFDVLWYLAQRAPEPVSNQELAKGVWKQSIVSDQTIAQRITMVRRALSDDASDPRFIRTVRGKGYAFIASREQMTEPDPGLSAERGRKWIIGIFVMVALMLAAAAIAWSVLRPPPILLDPSNGALRLDDASRSLANPGFAQVDGRPVLIAGLTDWALVAAHPVSLSVVCALRNDRSQFTSAIDKDLQTWLDDPAKDADCESVVPSTDLSDN